MNSLGKKTLIASAVAAALGSSAAFAVVPTTAPDAVFHAAGGSAQANAFYVAACKLLTNVDVYSDNGATLSGDYYVVYGTDTANNFGLGAGKNIMYMYKFNGGSFINGIQPNQTSGATTLPFPTQTSVRTGTTAQAAQGTACTGGLPTFSYTGGTNDAGDAPDFGLSDVEVSMFSGFNNPTGNALGAATNTNGGPAPAVGGIDGIYDNLFGIAVTANVFTNATHPKTNFTRAEMESIIEGTVSDWSQLFDDNGAQMPAGGIIFLDRQQGSGSKASGSQYFLGYPGDGASARFPFSASSGYCGVTLTACDATFVETALDVAEASTGTVISDLKLAQAHSIRAVAVLGLENPPAKNQVGGVNTFDFVKINGVGVDTGGASDNINGTVATSYVNVIKGDYDFYYQNSFNTRLGLAGQALTNANLFKVQMTKATFAGANAGLGFPSAVTGTLIDADNAAALAKGVTVASRRKNSQSPLQTFFNAPAGGLPASSEPL